MDHARLSADSDDEPDLFESRRSFARPSAADHVFGARAWILQRVGQSGDAISAGRGLGDGVGIERRQPHRNRVVWRGLVDRKSGVEGKSGSVRVDIGGSRHMKKKKKDSRQKNKRYDEP